MATYCFRCETCGMQWTSHQRLYSGELCYCGKGVTRRDYRAENVGVSVAVLKNEREHGGKEGIDRMFLPTNDDYKGPGDPDGTKGMREWRENHQPKAGNSNPRWPGTVDKQVM